MNDMRRQPDPQPDPQPRPEPRQHPQPGEPLAGPSQTVQGQPGPVNPEYHEHTIFDDPAEKVAQTPVDPVDPEPISEPTSDLPKEMQGARTGSRPATPAAIHRSLRTNKWVIIALLALALLAGLYFLGSRWLDRESGTSPSSGTATPAQTTGTGKSPGSSSGSGAGAGSASTQNGKYPAPSSDTLGIGQLRSVSCLSQTGPDATTTSRSFVDISGTSCVYKTGPTDETLVLNGKLTGRNTEGTGLSVTLNVNGRDCNGGEALSYARTYTPMYSNCTFVVPANSNVTIKWRFLSPFGGTAAVLRSSRNIAPSVTGVALPNTSDQP